LLIFASVPCTLASAAIWTRMAGGNEAIALLVTMLTTATSWLATTAWLAWTTGADTSVDTSGMMQGLALVLILPVGIGQAIRAVPALARSAYRLRLPIGVASRLLIFVMILRAALDVRDRLVEQAEALALVPVLATGVLSVGTHLL